MSLFEKSTSKRPEIEALTKEIRELRKSVAELKGEREGLRDASKLEAEITRLRKEKTEKEIELDRVEEKHERETREINHKLGLHRSKVEQETELAAEKARLAVREENLDADRRRFEDQIAFTRDQMKGEMEATRDLMKEVMERIPKFETIRRETLMLANGNGHEEDDE